MRATFIYPDLSRNAQAKFYHGIAFLSAVLKDAGHETSLIQICGPLPDNRFLRALEATVPELVAFSSTTNMFKTARHYAGLAKRHFPVKTICGGIHPTVVPEEVAACDEFDMLCVGEGEYALRELCDRLQKREDISGIGNIWVKEQGRVIRNPVRPLIKELDSLPFPDRLVFDRRISMDRKLSRSVFLASRGCPYDCSYCVNRSIRELYRENTVRFRSVSNVIEEIKLVAGRENSRYIVFHDDIFTLNMSWLEEFSCSYRRQVNIPFICNSRINLLSRESVSLLKDAGCAGINMGIESGSLSLREETLNRTYTQEQILESFELCRRAGIPAGSYNMIGIPGEGMEDILETIRINSAVRPRGIQVSIFMPYPATPLFELCKQNGMLSGLELGSYFEKTTLKNNVLNPRQVDFAFFNFVAMVRLHAACRQGFFSSGYLRKLLERLFVSRSPVLSFITLIIRFGQGVKYYVLNMFSRIRRLWTT